MVKTAQANLPVRPETRALLGELTDSIRAKTGETTTSMATVIHRALVCLKDAQERGAWLSPAEAAPVQEERLKRELVRVVGVLIPVLSPGREMSGISFDMESGAMFIHLKGGDIVEVGAGVRLSEPRPANAEGD